MARSSGRGFMAYAIVWFKRTAAGLNRRCFAYATIAAWLSTYPPRSCCPRRAMAQHLG
jgi:hypothetical protein